MRFGASIEKVDKKKIIIAKKEFQGNQESVEVKLNKKATNDKDKNSDKGRKDHNLTPQPSIKTALLEAASKRKGMESSPDGITETEPKSQKQWDEVG